MASLVIPDLHGCPQFLEWVLDEFPHRHLIFLGDLINRGPDSRAVLQTALALAREGRAQLLWGNHEHWAWSNLTRRDPPQQAHWLRTRAAELLESYGGDAAAVAADMAEFAEYAQPYCVEGQMLCAHAARPSLGRTPAELLDKGYMWDRPEDGLHPLPTYFFPEVRYSVHGHTSLRFPVVDLLEEGVVYLDLGSAKTGKFCIWDAESCEVIEYPGE